MLVLMSHPMQHIYNMFPFKLAMKKMQPSKPLKYLLTAVCLASSMHQFIACDVGQEIGGGGLLGEVEVYLWVQ